MDKFSNFIKTHGKKDLTFLGIGVLMLIIVIFYISSAIGFLAGSLGSALDKKTIGTSAVTRFQIEKAEALQKR